MTETTRTAAPASVPVPVLEIVIVNWNSGPWLRECLRALADAAPRACTVSRVVVVDNASSDGSCDGLGHDGARSDGSDERVVALDCR